MIERCQECGSWGVQCGAVKPVADCCCARCANARGQRLAAALREFLRIADEVQRAADERVGRAREAQQAARLARLGMQEEARAAIRRLDNQPVVWDFSRTVADLGAAAAKARKEGEAAPESGSRSSSPWFNDSQANACMRCAGDDRAVHTCRGRQ